jgi:6-phosphofructokinase
VSRPSFETRRVTVMLVEPDGTAEARDTLGKTHRVRWDTVRVPLPVVAGDLWLIDKSLGFWTFAAKIGETSVTTP